MQYDHFTFRSLMEDLPPLEYVDSTCFARDALKKMLASKCSQLPVLEKGKCIGVVTSESISRRLAQEAAQGNQATGFMNWPVTSFFDEHSPPLFVGPDEEIAEYAQTVGERGFALIGNPSRLKSLVTSGHLINFFMRKAEVFLVLREIETSIRYLIRQKLPNQALKDALGSIRPKDASQPMELEALSFDELRSLILARWDYLQNVFVDRDKTDWQLLKIRDLRNAAFHFRTHLFASHLSQLRNFRDYYLTLASKTIT